MYVNINGTVDRLVTQTELNNVTPCSSVMIPSNSIDERHINNNAITSRHIFNNSILGRHIYDSCISSRHIGLYAILERHISINAINSQHIKDGAIIYRHISNNSILEEHIKNNAVDSRQIKENAILRRHLSDNVINNSKIEDFTITTNKIKNYNITNEKLAPNSITSDKMEENSVKTQNVSFLDVSPNNTFVRVDGTENCKLTNNGSIVPDNNYYTSCIIHNRRIYIPVKDNTEYYFVVYYNEEFRAFATINILNVNNITVTVLDSSGTPFGTNSGYYTMFSDYHIYNLYYNDDINTTTYIHFLISPYKYKFSVNKDIADKIVVSEINYSSEYSFSNNHVSESINIVDDTIKVSSNNIMNNCIESKHLSQDVLDYIKNYVLQ